MIASELFLSRYKESGPPSSSSSPQSITSTGELASSFNNSQRSPFKENNSVISTSKKGMLMSMMMNGNAPTEQFQRPHNEESLPSANEPPNDDKEEPVSHNAILYHLQHQAPPHYSFGPNSPSPSPGSAGAVYMDNEKIITQVPTVEFSLPHPATPSMWYPGPVMSPNTAQSGSNMLTCHGPSATPSISPASFHEGYAASFFYQPPSTNMDSGHHSHHIDPSTGLLRPIQISPSILSPTQFMMISSSKRSDAISSITMKLKKKRESHNAVERRRRDNINERIQFLCSIVPECKRRQIQASTLASDEIKRPAIATSNLKLNKSFILQKATEYIEALTVYIEKQTQIIKEYNPNYVGGIEELNSSVLDDTNNCSSELSSSDTPLLDEAFHGNVVGQNIPSATKEDIPL